MKKDLVLTLSRKQAVLLLWLVDAVLDFIDSMDKIDFKFDVQELRDFRDYINFNLF